MHADLPGHPPVAPPSRRTLSRRGFLGTALGAAGGLALAGCGSPVAAGIAGTQLDPHTVAFWNLFGGGDGVRMQQMEDAFRKNHPDLGLEAVTLTWGNPYYTKLSLATVGDKPPDVGVSHLTRAKTLQASDLLMEFTPDLLARYDMSADRFTDSVWQAGLVDGRAYTIPLDTHPFVMFYNTDIAQKAGLLDTSGALKPIVGADGFMDALTAASQVTGVAGATFATTGDNPTAWRIFQTLYAQLGGEVLADQGSRVVLDDDRAVKALTFLRDLTKNPKLVPQADYQGSIALFANNQAGFFFQGEWEITTFQTAGTSFSMTQFPNVYGGSGGYRVQGDSHTFVVPKVAGDDPARTDRAMTFIRGMLDQSLTWAKGGHIPAWQPTLTSQAYQDLEPQSNYAGAAQHTVYDPAAWFSGSGSNFETIMGSAIINVMAGQATPAAAVSSMRSQLTRLVNTPSPV